MGKICLRDGDLVRSALGRCRLSFGSPNDILIIPRGPVKSIGTFTGAKHLFYHFYHSLVVKGFLSAKTIRHVYVARSRFSHALLLQDRWLCETGCMGSLHRTGPED